MLHILLLSLKRAQRSRLSLEIVFLHDHRVSLQPHGSMIGIPVM
jgi:hypothetical protein